MLVVVLLMLLASMMLVMMMLRDRGRDLGWGVSWGWPPHKLIRPGAEDAWCVVNARAAVKPLKRVALYLGILCWVKIPVLRGMLCHSSSRYSVGVETCVSWFDLDREIRKRRCFRGTERYVAVESVSWGRDNTRPAHCGVVTSTWRAASESRTFAALVHVMCPLGKVLSVFRGVGHEAMALENLPPLGSSRDGSKDGGFGAVRGPSLMRVQPYKPRSDHIGGRVSNLHASHSVVEEKGVEREEDGWRVLALETELNPFRDDYNGGQHALDSLVVIHRVARSQGLLHRLQASRCFQRHGAADIEHLVRHWGAGRGHNSLEHHGGGWSVGARPSDGAESLAWYSRWHRSI